MSRILDRLKNIKREDIEFILRKDIRGQEDEIEGQDSNPWHHEDNLSDALYLLGEYLNKKRTNNNKFK